MIDTISILYFINIVCMFWGKNYMKKKKERKKKNRWIDG